MSAIHVRTNVMFPDDLLVELRKTVPARERSAFIAEATRRQLVMLKQRVALHESAGAWSSEAHPELESGTGVYTYRTETEQAWSERRLRVAEGGPEYVPSGQ